MSETQTAKTAPDRRGRPFLLTGEGWPYLLVPFIPLAIVLEFLHADAVAVFAASALGVIPTAALMGRATEELAARSGPGIGGLLNVTFGNAPELIIALFALGAGLHEVVKASVVGSILGNILLVLGVSMLVGGARRDRQRFELRAATAQSLMLLLATVALVMPAIFQLVAGGGLPDPTARAVEFPHDLQALSVGVAVVLLASYAAGLVFSLRTHAHLFNPSHDEPDHGGEAWSVRKSVLMLAVAGAAVGWMSEILATPSLRRRRLSGCPRSLSASSSWRWWATPPSTGWQCISPPETRWTSPSTSRWDRRLRSLCSSLRCWCWHRSYWARSR
jgi:Ca2+:H+ antiporter